MKELISHGFILHEWESQWEKDCFKVSVIYVSRPVFFPPAIFKVTYTVATLKIWKNYTKGDQASKK